jgi:branched-chain amino acid transport system permease protein
MGINQYRIYNVAFGIGAATTGIAAVILRRSTTFFRRSACSSTLKVSSSSPRRTRLDQRALLGGIIIGVIESVDRSSTAT